MVIVAQDAPAAGRGVREEATQALNIHVNTWCTIRARVLGVVT